MLANDYIIPNHIEEAIKEFCRLVRDQLQDNVTEIRLFGSVARGTVTMESDVDILVVLKNKTRKLCNIIHDIAFDVGFDRDLVLSVIVDSEEEYNYPPFRETLFFNNLQKEGILL